MDPVHLPAVQGRLHANQMYNDAKCRYHLTVFFKR
jgi:hypothetical protein